MRPAPKTRTYTKLVSKMTDDELKACRRLRNTHGGTRIISDLVFARAAPQKKSQVVLVKEVGTKKLLSWGLIDLTEPAGPTLQLYTHGKYRRMGLGTKVVQAAKGIVGDTIRHFKHDDRAAAFFTKTQLQNPKVQSWLD